MIERPGQTAQFVFPVENPRPDGEIAAAQTFRRRRQSLQTLGDDRPADEPGGEQGRQGGDAEQGEIEEQIPVDLVKSIGFGDAHAHIEIDRFFRTEMEPLIGVNPPDAVPSATCKDAPGRTIRHRRRHIREIRGAGEGLRIGVAVEPGAPVVGQGQHRPRRYLVYLQYLSIPGQIDPDHDHPGYFPPDVTNRMCIGKHLTTRSDPEPVLADGE